MCQKMLPSLTDSSRENTLFRLQRLQPAEKPTTATLQASSLELSAEPDRPGRQECIALTLTVRSSCHGSIEGGKLVCVAPCVTPDEASKGVSVGRIWGRTGAPFIAPGLISFSQRGLQNTQWVRDR